MRELIGWSGDDGDFERRCRVFGPDDEVVVWSQGVGDLRGDLTGFRYETWRIWPGDLLR